MKKIKLSRNEVNVLAQVVSTKVTEAKTEAGKKLLAKDKVYLKWLKLNQERNELQDKINKLNTETNNAQREILNKYRLSIGYCRDYMTKEVKVNIWNSNNIIGNYNNIANEIVLMGIGSELNVDELIEKLVDKYSK
jgi:adenylosuccinate lyase